MSKNSFFLLLILIIFQLTYSKKEIMILEGDSFDEAIKNSIEAKSKLFIIFHIKKCPYCDHAIRVLKDRILSNYEDEDEINFALVNLDRQSNVWLGARFNITRIPYIILIENKKMYQFQNQFEESIVLKFIEDEKVIEDARDIPETFGLMNKVNLIMRDLNERIKESMQIIFDKYGIKIRWNNSMTYILLFILLIFIMYFENKLIEVIRRVCKFDKYSKSSDKNKDKGNEENKKKKEKDSENETKKENLKEKKE